jgi:hypothetical protein
MKNKTFNIKFCLVIIFIFIAQENILCQRDTTFFPPNEFTVSANLSVLFHNDGNTGLRLGFGAGIYKTWFEFNRFNLLVGISYNMLSLFEKIVKTEYSHYPSYPYIFSNATYKIHCISFPVAARFNIGKSLKFFIELGIFPEFNVYGSIKGTAYTAADQTAVIKERYRPEAIIQGFMDIGAIAGLGLKIPLKKNGLLIKTSYQLSFSKSYLSLSFGYRLLQNIKNSKVEK